MLSCHQCQELLTVDDEVQGICPHCGARLTNAENDISRRSGTVPAEDGAVDLTFDSPQAVAPGVEADPLTIDTTAETNLFDDLIPAEVATPHEAASVQHATTLHSQRDAGITNESELDEPLRTIIFEIDEDGDPDRTLGMDSLESDHPAHDNTAAVDSQVGVATDVHDLTPKPGARGTTRNQSRAQASESKLNIPERKIVWADDSRPPDLSADYEILLVENESKPELKGALGKGGVGIVWKALQRSLNREVAIKQLTESGSNPSSSRAPTGTRKVTERDRQSFLAEAVITANLEHPNIMPVYDLASDTQGSRLYTMKLLENPSWDKVIDERSEEENLEILRKVCEAIEYAHEKGVVHRDLKPANIVVGKHGEVLVIDWGLAFPLAHFQGPSVSPQQTGKGGTPTYMAPEQANTDPSGIGTHTDIYLLGAILFEIVTGLPPHPYPPTPSKSASQSEWARYRKELFQIVEDGIIIEVEQTGELMDIARKAMQKSPRDRYPSVKKFLEALKNYQRHIESTQLVRQASKDLQQANDTQDYAMFARSVFGFENAQKLWEANTDAREGLLNARLAYAQAALKKKDFDLGLTLVREDRPAEAGTYKKLVAGRDERRKQLARTKLYRNSVAALLTLLFVGGSLMSGWIYKERNDALTQKAIADEKKIEADEQRGLAEERRQFAETKRQEADEQRQIAEERRILAETKQKEADEQRMIAEERQIEADEQRKIADEKRIEADNQKMIAEEKRIEADEQKMIAETKRKEADEQKVIAEKRREEADEQKMIAEARRKEADEARQQALLEWYKSQLQLAGNYVAENAFDSAREVLRDIADQTDQERNSRGQLTDEEREAQPETFALLGAQAELDRLKELCASGNEDLIVYREENPDLTAAAATSHLLATANANSEVQLWSASTKKPALQHPLQTESEPSALAISPDSSLLVVGEKSGLITVWNASNGKQVRQLEGHQDQITRLMFLSADRLVSASLDKDRDKKLIVWNLNLNSPGIPRAGSPRNVLAIDVLNNPEGQPMGFVTGGNDRQIRFWPLGDDGSKPSTFLFDAEEEITALATAIESPATISVYWGDVLGDLRRAEFPLARIRAEAGNSKALVEKASHWLTAESLNRHSNGISQVLLDPVTSHRLISVGGDNLIRVWNIEPSSLKFQAELRRSIRFSSILTSDEKTATDQTRPREIKGHGNAIVDAAVWKDADSGTTRLLTASLDGTARIWEPERKDGVGPMGDKALSRLGTASGDVLAVSVARNSERVLAVSQDGIGMVWDLSIQPAPARLDEGHHFHTQAAIKLNHLLVTVSFDGTAAVWDTQTNAMLEKLEGIGPQSVLAGSQDGKFLITGLAAMDTNQDLNLQIWPLEDILSRRTGPDGIQRIAVGKVVIDKGKAYHDQPEVVVVSPSGQLAAVGTRNGFLQVFSPAAPQLASPTAAHPMTRDRKSRVPSGVLGVVFLSETEIATAGLDGVLRFWTVKDSELKLDPQRAEFEFRDPGDREYYRVKALSASKDGRALAAAVRYPAKTGVAAKTGVRQKPQLWMLEVHPAGARVIDKVQPEGSASEEVQSIALSGDGRQVIAGIRRPGKTGSKESVLREWTVSPAGLSSPGDILEPGDQNDTEIAQAIFASPNATDEIIVSGDALTNVWQRGDGGTLKRVAAYGPMMAMHACDLSADGGVAVTASHDLAPANEGASKSARLRGEIRLWQVKVDQGKLTAPRVAAASLPGAVNSVAICPIDSDLIAIGGYQRSKDNAARYAARLYRRDGNRLHQVHEIGSHNRPIITVQFTADGTRFLAVASDGSVSTAKRVVGPEAYQPDEPFDLSNHREELRLGELVTADLSGDGRWLAVADRRAAVVADAATGQAVVTELMQGHASDLTNVRFSAETETTDSPRLWSTSLDGSIKYWSLSEPNAKGELTPRPMLTLRGHQRGVLTLAALPDGGVASGGHDGRVILWPSGRAR